MDAVRVILQSHGEKRQAESDALVTNIRKNIVTTLQLEGWAAKDIRTLIENRPPREYPERLDKDIVLDVGPKLSDCYA